jgi:hypothetical protein
MAIMSSSCRSGSLLRSKMLVPALYYAALAVLATLPLAFVAGNTVLGWVGDTHYFIWLIDWLCQCVFRLHQSPWWVPYINHPHGVSLFCNETTPASVIMAMPFWLAGGATFAGNVVVLLTFFLSGVAMHLWVRRITACTAAAYVAGTLFAISPYRSIRTLGHLSLLQTQWLPLYFMCLTALLDSCDRARQAAGERISPYRPAAAAGVFLALLALSTAYYLYMTLVVSLFFVTFYALLVQKGFLRNARFWKAGALLIAVAAVPAGAAVAPYVLLRLRGVTEARSASDGDMYCASPENFVVPSWQHFLWGRGIERAVYRTRPIEPIQYQGAVALVLAGVALFRGRRIGERDAPGEAGVPVHDLGRLVPVLACTAGAAIVMALGNRLHVGDRAVSLPLSAMLGRMAGGDSIPVLLPGYALFKWLPFYNMMRAWARYGLYANLFVSVLAGIGTAVLLSRVRAGTRRAVGLALIGLAMLDFMPAHRFLFRVEPRAVDRWLASHGGPGAWMQYPFDESYRGDVNYNAVASGRPHVGGSFSFPPPEFLSNAPVLAGFPDSKSIDRLHGLGCRYVVVHSLRIPDWDVFRGAIEKAGLVHRYSADANHVFELPAAQLAAR